MTSFKIDEKQLLDDFLEMVQIDSPSLDERAMADYLIAKFKEFGCEVAEDNANKETGGNAGNLRVFLKGNVDSADPLMFSAHMDTVEPSHNIEPVIEDGIVRSKGNTILGSDDKAGIACILQLARMSKDQPDVPRGDLEFSLHISEEIGLLGAKNLDTSSFKSKIGYILDDHTPNEVCIGSPGAVRLDYTVFGKASHAGVEPEKGISALKVSAEAIARMNIGRIDEETTANIGVITGGSASNVITDKIEMKAEARSHNADKLDAQIAHMQKCFEDVCAEWRERLGEKDLPRFEQDRGNDYMPVSFSEDDYGVKLAMDAGRELGWEMKTKVSGGGTDGSVLTHKGIPCVVLGVGMDAVHSVNEQIKISELNDAAKLVATIVERNARA